MNIELIILEEDNNIPLILYYKEAYKAISAYKRLLTEDCIKDIIIKIKNEIVSIDDLKIFNLLHN